MTEIPAQRRSFRFSLRTLFLVVTVASVIAGVWAACEKSEAVGMVLTLWLMQAVVAIVLSSPIVYFGRQRASWQFYDLGAFVLPFVVWMICMSINNRDKTLSNLNECFIIAAAIPMAAAGRVMMGPCKHQWACSMTMIFALCAIAAAVYRFTPGLPE